MKLIALTIGILLGITAAHSAELTQKNRDKLESMAKLTQSQCIHYMVSDTSAYAQCVRDLRKKQSKDAYSALAVDYFGYVGAMSFLRVKTIGADTIAAEFLGKFRPQQKKLHISDSDLCSTVPGDCSARIAQTLAMEKSPQPAMAKRVQCQAGVCRFVEQPVTGK